MTCQSYELLVIDHGSQPSTISIGVEISQIESQMVIGLEILAAVVISTEEE